MIGKVLISYIWSSDRSNIHGMFESFVWALIHLQVFCTDDFYERKKVGNIWFYVSFGNRFVKCLFLFILQNS